MGRRLPLLVVTLAILAGACGGNALTTGRHLLGSHRVDRFREMPYLLWLPDGFDESRSSGYPMIVSLHGTGPTDYSPEFVMRYGLPAVLAQHEQPEGFDFVVLAPQSLDGVDWWSAGQPEEVEEIVEEIAGSLPIDPDRIYLTGFSTGGQGAWHLATRFPDRYAALISVAGSGYRSVNPVDESACRLASVPIWAIHGEDDLISVHDLVREEVGAWETMCGQTVRWTTYDDTGHFESFEIAYRDPEIYRWLLEQAG